jgi:hypothetical protein
MQTTLRPSHAPAHLQTLKRTKLATCHCAEPCVHEAHAHFRRVETDSREELGGVLRRALQDAGIQEKEAAAQLGIAQSLLSRWILGGEGLRFARLWALLGPKFKCCWLRELSLVTPGVSVESVIRVPELVS